jgi:hypothetical protein
MAEPVHNLALSLVMIPVLVGLREAVMSGKYSAEWWEKFAEMNRQVSARPDASNGIDYLIQATASGKPAFVGKAGHERLLRTRSRHERFMDADCVGDST